MSLKEACFSQQPAAAWQGRQKHWQSGRKVFRAVRDRCAFFHTHQLFHFRDKGCLGCLLRITELVIACIPDTWGIQCPGNIYTAWHSVYGRPHFCQWKGADYCYLVLPHVTKLMSLLFTCGLSFSPLLFSSHGMDSGNSWNLFHRVSAIRTVSHTTGTSVSIQPGKSTPGMERHSLLLSLFKQWGLDESSVHVH